MPLVTVPYRWKDDAPVDYSIVDTEIEHQLSIRLIVVNGLMHLQIGRFDLSYSPHVNNPTHDTYATITTFPLMYFTSMHRIPTRYLNPVMAATASYKRLAKSSDKARYEDWHTLQKELSVYRMLCVESENSDFGLGRYEKLDKHSQRVREVLEEFGYTGDAVAFTAVIAILTHVHFVNNHAAGY